MRAIFVTSSNEAPKLNRLASALIRGFDGGAASHVGIVVTDGMVIDSTFAHGGVREWPEHVWRRMDGRRVVADITIDLPNERAAAEFARAQIGKRYDWTALAGMALWGDWATPDRWYCTELMAATMQAGGIDLSDQMRRIGCRVGMLIAERYARHP